MLKYISSPSICPWRSRVIWSTVYGDWKRVFSVFVLHTWNISKIDVSRTSNVPSDPITILIIDRLSHFFHFFILRSSRIEYYAETVCVY